MTKQRLYARSLLLIIFLVFFAGAIYVSYSLSRNDVVQELVANLGYLGALLTGLIAGLNNIAPIPAATFTPVFVAAGFSLPSIILAFTLGTIMADLVGYFFGHASRELVKNRYPDTFQFFTRLKTEHSKFIVPIVILYVAFVPFPNEVIIIPLALSGVRLSKLLLPLVLGNLLNQTLLVYGYNSFFNWLF